MVGWLTLLRQRRPLTRLSLLLIAVATAVEFGTNWFLINPPPPPEVRGALGPLSLAIALLTAIRMSVPAGIWLAAVGSITFAVVTGSLVVIPAWILTTALVGRIVLQANAAQDVLTLERRKLADQVLYAEERERQRIASELHDDTVQVMAAIPFMLDSALRRDPNMTGEVQRILESCARSLRGCMERTRQLTFELRPAVLEHSGLSVAVADVVNTAATLMEPKPEVEVNIDVSRFDPAIEALVFQVMRELIANVRKHSQATRIEVSTVTRAHTCEVIIKDNGTGFDLTEVTDASQVNKHLGLLTTRERVSLAGGRMDVVSEPGDGTAVYVVIPID